MAEKGSSDVFFFIIWPRKNTTAEVFKGASEVGSRGALLRTVVISARTESVFVTIFSMLFKNLCSVGMIKVDLLSSHLHVRFAVWT